MAQISIPYGRHTQELVLADERLRAVLRPAHTQNESGDESAIVRKALENPIASPRLCELVKGKEHIVLITSDHTRPVPSRVTMPLYLEEIRRGNPQARVTILIATGMHRPTTEAELRQKLGDEIVDREEIVVHRAEVKEDMAFFGTLPSGGELWLNKLVKEADLVISEGFVEPHFFAGFSGGRKSILPGVSAMDSICHNHAYALDPDCLRSNPRIGNGKLTDNPLNDDMCEAAGLVPNLFMVNLVMNAEMQLAEIYAGHYLTSWKAACAAVDRIYRVEIPQRADVIVAGCGGFPKDMSLYQGTKTIDNIESGLKLGGTLILIIEARDGGGPAEYFDWIDDLQRGTMEKRLREHFTVPGYIFLLNCEQAHRYNILMLSTVAQETVAPMGLKSFNSVEKLMAAADLEGKTIYVVPNGSTVVPHVKGEA